MVGGEVGVGLWGRCWERGGDAGEMAGHEATLIVTAPGTHQIFCHMAQHVICLVWADPRILWKTLEGIGIDHRLPLRRTDILVIGKGVKRSSGRAEWRQHVVFALCNSLSICAPFCTYVTHHLLKRKNIQEWTEESGMTSTENYFEKFYHNESWEMGQQPEGYFKDGRNDCFGNSTYSYLLWMRNTCPITYLIGFL